MKNKIAFKQQKKIKAVKKLGLLLLTWIVVGTLSVVMFF